MTDFARFATEIRSLSDALMRLQPLAQAVGVGEPTGSAWHNLLRRKLLPQLDMPPLLVVGVVGGTNIGKSVVFNHLAGCVSSAISPMAAGTKHPVCLVPPGAADPKLLETLFVDFELLPWRCAESPLEEAKENRLFWRVEETLPERLLLLDAPDVDSDAEVNWQRARAIRESADLLVAVLTQQKYNDAAVKRFFREAVQADKPLIVVFNQCHIEADAEFWPLWLETFCRSTGASPENVYVLPHDREAAEALRLPFHPVGKDGRMTLGPSADLREELATLRFDEIKVRTMRGAVNRLLESDDGVDAYLRDVKQASGQFDLAVGILRESQLATVKDWPTLPSRLIVDIIRDWWDKRRPPWSRRIHGGYRTVGRLITRSFQTVKNVVLASERELDPLEQFHAKEHAAILEAVEKLIGQLQTLSKVGNETLQPRLQRLLAGRSREMLLGGVARSHEALEPVDDDFRAFVDQTLDEWSERNPQWMRVLGWVDSGMAVLRPTISVALVIGSWGLAGGLVGLPGHAANEILTEAVITGGLASGGEAAVGAAAGGLKEAAGQLLQRLQNGYTARRAGWLAQWLETEFLGKMLDELQTGAHVTGSEPMRDVHSAIERIRRIH